MRIAINSSSCFRDSNIRLDARYHLSDGKLAKRMVLTSKYDINNLRDVATDIFYGGRARRVYVKDKEKGVPFMGSADMLKTDFNGLKYISRKHTSNLSSYIVKPGWILVSRSGTIGNTTYTNADFDNKAASEHIIRIIPNGKMLPGTIYAYLSSKFGYALMTQGTFGAVIQHIEPEFLAKLPVPTFSENLQNRTNTLIQESAELKEKATAALRTAHGLLTSRIFEKPISRRVMIGSCTSKNVATVLQSRLDASFYLNLIPIEDDFSHNIKFQALRTLVKRPMFTALRGKRNYVKNGIKFLSTTDISQSNPLLINQFLSLNTFGLKSLIVEKNWILVARSGSEILGSSFLVDSSYDKTAVNEHSIRVIIDETKISPHFIYGYLSHPRIKDYIRAGIYGSAILTINEDYLERLKVPMLPADTVKEISDLVLLYQQSKEESCRLEFEAISLIEQEIESWQK